MPQKTRKEKILAEKRRQKQLLISPAVPAYSLDIKPAPKTSSEAQSVQNTEKVNILTGHADLKSDLLKISLFTVGAVAFQLILFFFVIK
ncbi:hypothetical protein A3D77_07730 [Candidatus Gottesmanbacteria bacterium RIFCSPHIGHO2_02_FULL_39_11]|uniref:Uncharacterized protein n=1 Tax=Candidatus Gottesmanbacteria bacterium RIFCSPHIGHO2_02_FULL_39_11 TaxID=1798382 RepID=A0A1F5ZSK7_9BACT|nr:MAG: hypothetical protein A3D77_07730 [Candidatus Gottesmanbacteria bacterium RIFCSPHIGHO2_02_FULL_39_11]